VDPVATRLVSYFFLYYLFLLILSAKGPQRIKQMLYEKGSTAYNSQEMFSFTDEVSLLFPPVVKRTQHKTATDCVKYQMTTLFE
jgi:hypothetical protein